MGWALSLGPESALAALRRGLVIKAYGQFFGGVPPALVPDPGWSSRPSRWSGRARRWASTWP
jgi:hypothetical protein